MSNYMDKNISGDVSGRGDLKLLMEALMGEMRRILRVEMEHIHEWIDWVESACVEQPQNIPNVHRRERVQPRELRVEDEEYYGDKFDKEDDRGSIVRNRRHGGRFREARNREDNNLGNIKMKISSFQGKNDPEAYLEWEKKMELVFDCHNCSKFKKVKLVAIEFSDYAIV